MGDKLEELKQLAEAVKRKNAADTEISRIILRPTERGHAGEYIAVSIFGICPEQSASHKGTDGKFTDGNLRGKTVNIKWYGKRQGILDMNLVADYYLVMTGPKSMAVSSRRTISPWVIEGVFLFNGAKLRGQLKARGIARIGTATSVAQELWKEAEIYPEQRNNELEITKEQRGLLALFAESRPSLESD